MKFSKYLFKLPNVKIQPAVQEFAETYDWGLVDLHIPEIHKSTLGEDIKICVIDSGKCEHFETKNNIVAAKNFSSSHTVNDVRGHSTIVCTVLAAEKNNQGIVGVAPKAQLYCAKAIDDSGNGSPNAMVKSVYWAIDEKVDLITISAGMFFNFKPLHEAIKIAYSKNITIIAAAGNTKREFENIAYPARYPEVIGVAAYNKKYKVADFSSRGINIFCAMPGVDIYAGYLNNQFVKTSGSSFAAPIMTGICALILSSYRKKHNIDTKCDTPQELMQHLRKYAKKLKGTPDEVGFGTIDTEKLFGEI